VVDAVEYESAYELDFEYDEPPRLEPEPETLTGFARRVWDAHRKRDCTLCPLHDSARTVCLFGNGPRSDLMVVADHPTEEDDRFGPFSAVNPQWGYLGKSLSDVGVEWDDVYKTYAVRCLPPRTENRDDLVLSSVKECQPYLLRELWRVRPTAILTLGANALYSITRQKGLGNKRGQAVRWTLPCACEGSCCSGRGERSFEEGEGPEAHLVWETCPCGGACHAHEGHEVWLVPTVSPNAVLVRPSYHSVFLADVAKWQRLGRGIDNAPEVEIVEVVSPRGLEEARQELLATRKGTLTFDLETRGFQAYRPGYSKVWSVAISTGHRGEHGVRVFSIPLEHPDSPWFKPGPINALTAAYPEVRSVVEAVCSVIFDHETKLSNHNLKFDLVHLVMLARRYGIATPYD
jgi:uracil-DNA glycosylase family 4